MISKNRIGVRHGIALPIVLALVAILAVLGIVGIRVATKLRFRAPTAPDKTAKFVTAAPIDFEQIESISKFRSCAGHDYSGKDIDGLVESERSMKHYASPIKSLVGSTNQIKIFAPFDAVVVNNSEGKRGDNLDLSPIAAPGFLYELGHISSQKSLPEGSHVKAGELIGYYNDNGAFDLQFWFGGKETVNSLNGYFDSIFAHMTPALAQQLEKYGLSESNLIVSKAERDASPCTGSTKDMGSTIFEGSRDKDYVLVKNTAQQTTPQSQNFNNESGNAECQANIPANQKPPGCNSQQ